MSKARRRAGAKGPAQKDAFGNPKCRFCGGMVRSPRRTFCSDECVHEHRIRTSPEYLRACVMERDRGICSQCGFDAAYADGQIEFLRSNYHRAKYGTLNWILKKQILLTYVTELETRGFRLNREQYLRPGSRRMRSLWEADHIVSVVEGGGETGLDNLMTLCLCCHRQKTNELKHRLRESKKGLKDFA